MDTLRKSSTPTVTAVITLGLVMVLFGCGEKIDGRQIEVQHGQFYKLNASDPFTGTVTNYPALSMFKLYSINAYCTLKLKKGDLDGTTICFANNRTKIFEADYTEGKKDGAHKQWDEISGKLTVDARWDQGNLVSGFTYYPKSGKRQFEEHWTKWENGQRSNGTVKAWAEGVNTMTGLDTDTDSLIKDYVFVDGKATGCETVDRWGKFECYEDGVRYYDNYLLSGIRDAPTITAIAVAFSSGKILREEAIAQMKQALQKVNSERKAREQAAAEETSRMKDCMDGLLAAFIKQSGNTNAISHFRRMVIEKVCKDAGMQSLKTLPAYRLKPELQACLDAQPKGASEQIRVNMTEAESACVSDAIYFDPGSALDKISSAQPVVVPSTSSNTQSATHGEAKVQACIDAKVNAFHKQNGDDTPINHGVLQEWKIGCGGKPED